jgi:hypothetical protein
MELATQRKRTSDAEAMVGSVQSAARSAIGVMSPGGAPGGEVFVSMPSITNKRNDDARGGDVEGALLSGGGDSSFVPLAQLLRRTPPANVCGSAPVLAFARTCDKATVALHRRPAARLVLGIYLLAVHAVFFSNS